MVPEQAGKRYLNILPPANAAGEANALLGFACGFSDSRHPVKAVE
jgi:hypothetical protein